MPKALPKPVYPLALDSDYTLFKTYNSSQSVLVENLSEKDDAIYIQSQTANKSEIWPENGFVTIQDELIYYDAVEKDGNGKVFCLKDCIRGVEGTVQSYRVGTDVMANAVAQTHNQLVETIVAIESAIGEVGEMLKLGPELTAQRNVKKNFVPRATVAAEVDHQFAASLQQSLTTILGVVGSGEDACPDVEFELNNIGSIAEYCVRIFGTYNTFSIDFDDGTAPVTNQLSGTHTYIGSGPFNPTITVVSNNCTIVQMPTTPNEFLDGPTLPNPSVPFVILVPDFPAMPQFAPPSTTCPGPLFNLPPIMMPDSTCCPIGISNVSSSCMPSVIISVIEACTTPQIISISSPCILSNISLIGIPSVINLVGTLPSLINISCISFCAPPSFDCISFCEPPSFDCISICTPSFDCISFCEIPSFDCISFCKPPSFDAISFAPFPQISTISVELLVSLTCMSFCKPPSFDCISFCEPPTISVNWGTPPLVSVIVQCSTPSTSGVSNSGNSMMGFAPQMENYDNIDLPVNYGDLGIPDEILLKHDLPRSINVSHDLPQSIFLDTADLPRTILLEASPNLPSSLMLEVGPLPKLEVVGIPKSIEIIENIPRTIQLLMPPDPTVTMRWDGVPVEMKPSPELEKLLANLTIQPR